MPEPIVEVSVRPAADKLRLEWGLSVGGGQWLWSQPQLEVHLYCEPFPTTYGNPELIHAGLEGFTTTYTGQAGFHIPIVPVDWTFGKEKGRGGFYAQPVSSDSEGRYFPLHLHLDEITPGDAAVRYFPIEWPVDATWLCQPFRWWVEFGYRTHSGKFIQVQRLSMPTILVSATDATTKATPIQCVSRPYVLTQIFFGRQRELALLDEWAISENTTFIIESIGGVGKSALCWEWFEHHSLAQFDVVIWWSFYEPDASVENFLQATLACITDQAPGAFGKVSRTERERRLVEILSQNRCLLVLDGLERILVAYQRSSTPHLVDDGNEPVDSPVRDRMLRTCTDLRDTRFLQQLTLIRSTKLLISTRLIPVAMENKAGILLPNIQLNRLGGLLWSDAFALLKSMGVRGNARAVRDFASQFENHSLLLLVIAGRIRHYHPLPGDFDAWYADEGCHLRISELDLKQRRTHILRYALEGLATELRSLLGRVATVRYAIDYDTIHALNPYRDLLPSGEAEHMFHAGLDELEDRGLLRWDRGKNHYDLHPIVRKATFESLGDTEQQTALERVRDHFQSLPPTPLDQVKEISDLRRELAIYWTFIDASLLEAAARFYWTQLADVLNKNLCAFHKVFELLTPLFSHNLAAPPPIEEFVFQCGVMDDMSNALLLYKWDIHLATQLSVAKIRLSIEHKDVYWLSRSLLGHTVYLISDFAIAEATRTAEVAEELISLINHEDLRAHCNLRIMDLSIAIGRWDRAQAAYEAFRANPAPISSDYWLTVAEQAHVRMKFLRGIDVSAEVDQLWNRAQAIQNVWTLRVLQLLRGEIALREGNFPAAINYFQDTLVMERRQGLQEPTLSQYNLALAYAKNGRAIEARELISEVLEQEKILGDAMELEVAEVFLVLGETTKAAELALKGYQRAWADGLPFSWWEGLEKAKKVLAELGIDPPELPPFDPEKTPLVPYEDEVRTIIEETRRDRGDGAPSRGVAIRV